MHQPFAFSSLLSLFMTLSLALPLSVASHSIHLLSPSDGRNVIEIHQIQ